MLPTKVIILNEIAYFSALTRFGGPETLRSPEGLVGTEGNSAIGREGHCVTKWS